MGTLRDAVLWLREQSGIASLYIQSLKGPNHTEVILLVICNSKNWTAQSQITQAELKRLDDYMYIKSQWFPKKPTKEQMELWIAKEFQESYESVSTRDGSKNEMTFQQRSGQIGWQYWQLQKSKGAGIAETAQERIMADGDDKGRQNRGEGVSNVTAALQNLQI